MRIEPKSPFEEFERAEIEGTITARFERRVAACGDRLALKTADDELTYEALHRAANRVARAVLDRRGEGAEPVALLFGGGPRMVAAILGVLKAGKFWVPLDVSHPEARTRAILASSEATVLLTDTRGLRLARSLGVRETEVVDLDAAADLPGGDLHPALSPDALAYVLYTSGSTGEPKGIVHTHRSVLHSVRWHTNSRRIRAEDRLSLFAPYTHTSGVSDIFRALLNGAALLPFEIREEGMGSLAAWLIREEVTIYHSTPTVFRHFVSTLRGDEAFPRLRLIVLGGETVSRRDVELFQRHFSPDCLLLNHLGASEVSTYRQYFIERSTRITTDLVPVGYPVEDKEVFLLDDRGNEVAPGRVGEIAVRSRYLSPGYWRRPDLTRQAFSPAPGGSCDERVYRTGDLGRLEPDGCLYYLGRNDSQVQIRGHRVELAEIEATLLAQSSVREAAVIVLETRRGDQRLAAFVVPSTGSLDLDELRQGLRDRLPDYMVPSRFELVDSLPLTSNGKVDRLALSAAARSRPEPREGEHQAARNELEQRVASIWRDVLELESVGVHEDFFDLGGHSLSATQVVNRIERHLAVRLPVTEVFESPTIAGLARAIEAARRGEP